jgi:preprotein translocase subunit SecA
MTQERWTAVSYAELLADTPATIQRLCRFADISFDESLSARCNEALPLSRYTQTAPRSGKWRKNEAMIERVMPSLRSVIERIEIAVAPHSSSAVLISGPILDLTHDTQVGRKSIVDLPGAGDAIAGRPDVQEDGRQNKILGRNARCDCGSGKRYKHCHGKILV